MRLFTFVATLFLAVYAADLALLLALHRRWWRRGWVRRALLGALPLALTCAACWNLGFRWESVALTRLGAGTLSVLFIQLTALLLALALTLPVRLGEIGWDLARRWRPLVAGAGGGAREARGPSAPERRRFLRAALAAVPMATAATAAGGVFESALRPRLPVVPLRFPDLPEPLRGLRILQLSDIHVGPYVGLGDLEALVERAGALSPDLVVVTGDICDHMPVYPDCLRLLEQLRPALGTFACLGNHEYFRGIARVRASFAGSKIPLLVDEGLVLPVGAARLRIAGADDPRSMGDPSAQARLVASVDRCLDGADSGSFHLLISHRSQAFDRAASQGVHLTLAGHTHGYQLGFAGRSLFEGWHPGNYIWGHYGGGSAQLYTSAGVGHWFPFRLGCPPEAPLFVLEEGGT